MKEKIVSSCLIRQNGDVSILMFRGTKDDLERLILKDGVVTTEPMKAGEASGILFTVDNKLIPAFFEALQKFNSDELVRAVEDRKTSAMLRV